MTSGLPQEINQSLPVLVSYLDTIQLESDLGIGARGLSNEPSSAFAVCMSPLSRLVDMPFTAFLRGAQVHAFKR